MATAAGIWPESATAPTTEAIQRGSPLTAEVVGWRWWSTGGQEAFDAAVGQMLDQARGWRLAELRKRRDMTQEQVATRMGISVSRVSQIENGDVSTQDVLARYIAALGGTLKLIADFGDEQLKVA